MALEVIRLNSIVDHCKLLPTYRDSLPFIDMLQSIALEEGMAKEIAVAIKDIRSHFRVKQQSQDDHQQQKLPPPLLTPEMPELRFFKDVSDHKAPFLKILLRDGIQKMDLTGKKDWFCLYAAWRYFKKEREVGGGYVDFFLDIEAFFPGLLADVRTDLPGNRRLKPYTDMLAYEYKLWAVDMGKLPPMQTWAHSEWKSKYLVNTKETIERMQQLVREFYVAFSQLLGTKKH
jgi:hypothetical protein